MAVQKDTFREEAAFYGDYSIPPLTQSLEELEAEAAAKIVLKAEVGDAIAASVRVTLSGETCLLGRPIVDWLFQKRGIGSALLPFTATIYPSAVRHELFTEARSAGNLRLYERLGYIRFREEAPTPAVTDIYMQKYKATNQHLQPTP